MKKLFPLLFIVSILMSCGEGFNTYSSHGSSKNETLSGSYATILNVGNFLYAVDVEELHTFDVSDAKNPVLIDKQDVGFEIENLYYSEGVLFIGSRTNLYIYAIDDKGIPRRKSATRYFNLRNVTSCDPVIVSGEYAFITLSGSTENQVNDPCSRSTSVNELRIYNVSDLENPKLLSATRLPMPKGLSLDGQYLFVCLAKRGLAVFDVTDKEEPVEIKRLEGFASYDVIAKDGLMMIVCPKEIREYDYSDINNIKFLSKIDL